MAVYKNPLCAGQACGLPIVTWVESVRGSLVANAQGHARSGRLRSTQGALQGEAHLALAALRLRLGAGALAALAWGEAPSSRLRVGQSTLAAIALVEADAQAWLPLQPEPPERHRRYDQAAFEELLLNLMPRGRAWPRDGEDGALMAGWAAELHRVETRGWQLFEEWDPRTTEELFTDWEQFFELPGTGTPEQRRQALIAEWLAGGTLSRSDIESLLERLGIDATVEYWQPFRVGLSTVGERLNNNGYSTWIVYVHNPEDIDLAWLQDYLRRLAPAGDYVHVIAAVQHGVTHGSHL